MSAAPSDIKPDTLVGGKLRLIQRIGRGGMGEVWVARNEATQAEVAVKTLQRSERKTIHEDRFRREARLAATISHRHVVRIFDLVDEADGTLGLVMELLRGGTLEVSLRDIGPMPTAQALAVALPILAALQHVHDKGIVHRDVKPSNIFFAVEPDGHVIPKILDFGIAKLPAQGAGLTVDGSVLGTPHYMSPEQIRGHEDLDGRSDLFSLAVVLYEMLTGVRVFQRDLAAASLASVLEHDVDPDPRIEPRLWLALSRALGKRPYERYASCSEFAEALRSASGVADEELASALQELRPRMDEVPDTVHTQFEVVAMKPRATSQRRTLLWTIAAASAGALVAVAATLAITRSSGASPEGASLSAVPAPTEVSSNIVGASALPAVMTADAGLEVIGASSAPAVASANARPPTSASTSVPGSVAATTGAKGAVRVSTGTAKSASPNGARGTGPKPIATTPGF